ncbi:MAG TPA: shikimate dehydrogenase [Nitrospirota bacterium]|nr:shikimate dehydrogenase [Nitrospirota bacterium]
MISGKTKLYGIFGYPVEHTFSPGMHNAAFQKLHLDACYVPFAVSPDNLGDAAKSLIPLGICGVNVTIPHKEMIRTHLDGLSEEARLIGAVNTIEIKEGKLIGHNTDGRGFLRSLRDNAGFNPKGKQIFIIGSGGAARAVGFSLALAGTKKIIFTDLDALKAVALVTDITEKTGRLVEYVKHESIADAAAKAHCIINATPLGLKRTDPLPIARENIQKKHLICDLVYNPAETRFLQAAKAKGAEVLSGIGMLLYQGVIAFEIWTGQKAPITIMKDALVRQIAARRSHSRK